LCLVKDLKLNYLYTHTHTHTHIYICSIIYIYIYNALHTIHLLNIKSFKVPDFRIVNWQTRAVVNASVNARLSMVTSENRLGSLYAALVSLIYRCLIIEPFDIDVDRIGLIEMLGNTMSCDDSASAAYCFYHNGGLQIAPLTFAKRLSSMRISHAFRRQISVFLV